MNSTGYARGRATGEGKVFANRFADDLGTGIEQPRDDGGVEFRHKGFQHRSAVRERNAGEGIGVLYGDFFPGKLAIARALDMRLRNPRAVFVLFALWPVVSSARIFDLGDVVRQ